MADEKDVKVVPSTTDLAKQVFDTGAEEAQETVVETPQTEEAASTPAEETSETQTPPPVKAAEPVDEKGVPWANREAEIRRKLRAEMAEEQRILIQQGIQEALKATKTEAPQTSSQSPLAQYSDEQLLWIEENDANWKFQARLEREKRIEKRAEENAFKRLKGETTKQTDEQVQQAAIQNVLKKYPNVNDPTNLRWNESDPLYQRAVQIYNSHPSFKQPGGIEVAFDKAYAEMALAEKGKLEKEKLKVTQKERREQKSQSKAMSAGSVQTPPDTTQTTKATEYQKTMEAWQKTKDPKLLAKLLQLKGVAVPLNI